MAASLNNLAELYRSQGQNEKAELLFKKSLSIYKKSLGPNHPFVAMSLENLALLYKAEDRVQEADGLTKQAKRIRSSKQ